MLAYAPRPASRAGSPRTMLLVAAGHALALALVLTARSEYVARTAPSPTQVVFVDPLEPPPPPRPEPNPTPHLRPLQSTLDRPHPVVVTPPVASDPVAEGPAVTSVDPLIGNAVVPILSLPTVPTPAVVRKAARFITPADQVRPPYPVSKQRLEQAASLRLSLVIDADGRVSAVNPVGSADAVFLDAARRHILRHWRYQPATAGGSAVASTIVVTLRFELEN